jgi:hypothetical protein
MARMLLFCAGMSIRNRSILLLVLVALLSPARTLAQENSPPDGTPIKSAQVSGLDISRLSPGLQADISRLPGSGLDRQRLRELAARIEAEQPRFVTALRVTPDPDGGARVVFVVARMREPELQLIPTWPNGCRHASSPPLRTTTCSAGPHVANRQAISG